MEAKELRIGNYVNNFDKCFVIRNGEDIDDITRGIYNHTGKPILLTEDWLLKFGFKYDDWHWTLGENPLTKDYLIDICWIDGCEYPFYRNGHFTIKYVHQLQNLYFALTGKELEVKPECVLGDSKITDIEIMDIDYSKAEIEMVYNGTNQGVDIISNVKEENPNHPDGDFSYMCSSEFCKCKN